MTLLLSRILPVLACLGAAAEMTLLAWVLEPHAPWWSIVALHAGAPLFALAALAVAFGSEP